MTQVKEVLAVCHIPHLSFSPLSLNMALSAFLCTSAPAVSLRGAFWAPPTMAANKGVVPPPDSRSVPTIRPYLEELLHHLETLNRQAP